jgi:hypothetical protein
MDGSACWVLLGLLGSGLNPQGELPHGSSEAPAVLILSDFMTQNELLHDIHRLIV